MIDMFVDTHAHIYLDEFSEDRTAMIDRTREAGVGRIYMPNIDRTSVESMLALEEGFPGMCIPMMGLHPCYVKHDFEKHLAVVEHWLSERAFAAVGEIGTDLYWDKTFWSQQQEAFRIQLDWAKQYSLPVVIHCRESIDETIALVAASRGDSLRGIFHCFSGNADQARRITEMGFLLGIGGVATFKNGGLDKVLPGMSLSNIVLETDSPYLAPVPFRGKRNEPSYIPVVASRVAEIMKVSLDEVREATTRNANALFAL